MPDSAVLFGALAARPRRQILFLLLDSESVEIPDALRTRSTVPTAEQPENAATGTPTGDSPVSRSKEIALHHQHLPKLEANGFVDWDRDANVVSKGPNYEAVEPALRVLVSNATRFPPDMV